MKSLRHLCSILAVSALAAAAFAADPTGTWNWNVTTPTGEVETTLKLTSKDGKFTGAYSNSFGDTAVSNVTLKEDALAFDVERDLGGSKFVLKFRGKLDGDTIKGTIDVPGVNGGEPRQLEWNAKRVKEASAPAAKK